MEPETGRKLGDNPVVIILGIVSSVLAIFIFVTGYDNIHMLFENKGNTSQINTPTSQVPATSTEAPELLPLPSPSHIPIQSTAQNEITFLANYLLEPLILQTDHMINFEPDWWPDGNVIEKERTLFVINSKSTISYDLHFADATGALIKFQMSPNSEFEIYFDNINAWGSETYREFGLLKDKNGFTCRSFYKSIETKYEMSGKINDMSPDKWYEVILGLNNNGEILVAISDSNDATLSSYCQHNFGSQWKDWAWRFGTNVESGSVSLDFLSRIAFDGFTKQTFP